MGALQQADIPIRLVNGSADPIPGGHMADHVEQLEPNADIVRLAGIGYSRQLEDPEAISEAVLSFFAHHEQNPITPEV